MRRGAARRLSWAWRFARTHTYASSRRSRRGWSRSPRRPRSIRSSSRSWPAHGAVALSAQRGPSKTANVSPASASLAGASDAARLLQRSAAFLIGDAHDTALGRPATGRGTDLTAVGLTVSELVDLVQHFGRRLGRDLGLGAELLG